MIVRLGARVPSAARSRCSAGRPGPARASPPPIIAAELTRRTGEPWALYALDLGRIMSKYVGETEQNLNALLDALDGRRAILQIDEADGLLGKRGEITDARDRYANLEVSHMLSRFERHDGPVILTTNLRTNIDAAFLRRFQQVVDFPAPDARRPRQALGQRSSRPARRARRTSTPRRWRAPPAFPAARSTTPPSTPRCSPAEEAAPLAPRHLARAVWAELNKDNRQVRRSELGALAGLSGGGAVRIAPDAASHCRPRLRQTAPRDGARASPRP